VVALMGLKARPLIKREQTDDRQINDLQRRSDDAIRELQDTGLANGRIIRGIEMPSGQVVTIDHGLGRTVANWWPVRIYYNQNMGPNAAKFSESSNQPTDTTRQINLVSDVDAVADFYMS
jgi:hypothetical protein